MFKFFHPNSDCFAKYDTFCSHIFSYACLRLTAIEHIRNYRKLYASKTFLKMAGGRMDIPHPTPLDSPLAISYRNHQKNLTYFSHLAPSVVFLLTKRQSQKGRGAWHNGPAPKYAPEGRI